MGIDAGRLVALKNLQQQTYELLVDRILGLEPGYEPGSRLDIPALAAELGVSPTPIKESLRLLQAHGLIEMSHRRGTFVASLSREQFDEYIDVLRELEFAALRLAGLPLPVDALRRLSEQVAIASRAIERGQEVEEYHANQVYHELLVELSGNHELLKLYTSPRGYLLAVAYRTHDPAIERALLQQHVEITEALTKGDLRRAQERIATHWEDCRALGHKAIDEIERRTSAD